MEKINIQYNTDKLLAFVSQKYQTGELDNNSLVEFIKLSGSYLNLKTIPDYAKEKGMSYEGVKKFRNTKEIFNVKFVIDND